MIAHQPKVRGGSFSSGILSFLSASPWPGSLLLLIMTVSVLQLDLGQAPEFDELYHVLAAEGWLQTGTLSIAEGVYERVGLYTHLIARSFEQFGVSLEVARQPSVIAAAILVFLVFQWSFRQFGAGAAWFASLLLALSPFLIDVAQFVRFYALQGLCFFTAAIALYAALGAGLSLAKRAVFGALSLIAIACAAYLQPVSLIGLGGMGLWAAAMLAIAYGRGIGLDLKTPLPSIRPAATKHRLLVIAGIALVGLVVFGLMMMTEFGHYLITKYTWAPVWNRDAQGQFVFYHVWLVLYYPSLWPIFPILMVVALASAPRPAAFAATVFIAAFLLHSFAAVKDLRYLFYAMPFLFILWGAALAAITQRTIRFVTDRIEKTGQSMPGYLVTPLRPAFWIAAVGFLILANAAAIRSATMLAGVTIPPEQPPTRWQEARPALQPWIDDADIVITSNELHALYYLDRYDILFSHSRSDEIGGTQFARDYRTGRPVIDDREILAQLIACHASGLIVSPDFRWRNPTQIDAETADLIKQSTEPLILPEGTRLRAFTWKHDVVKPEGTPTALLNRPATAAREHTPILPASEGLNCPDWQAQSE